MTMEDWSKRLDAYLRADDLDVLQNAGKISAEIAQSHAITEFEKYRIVQDRLFRSDFDRFLEEGETLIPPPRKTTHTPKVRFSRTRKGVNGVVGG